VTTIENRPGGAPATPACAEVAWLPGDRAAVTGTVAEVAAMLAQLRAAGRLVAATMPAPTGVPGQMLVNCRLAPMVQRRAAPAPVKH
jgi:hypothetical protein